MSRINQIHEDYLDPDKHLWPAEEEGDEGEPSEAEMLASLDAYGHLTWTMGDDDWMACFDAKRFGKQIAYHAVVNCESGGWIDTIEKGIVPTNDPQAINTLINLAERFVDAGLEGHYQSLEENQKRPRDQRRPLGHFAWKDCDRGWRRHINQLVAETLTEMG